MLGFEVRFNEEVILTSIDSGVMEVIFTSGGLRKKDSLHIWGFTAFHEMGWYSSDVECDKIAVRIVNVERGSEPIEKKDRFKSNEEMLRKYYEQKQELKKEGLL
jgi:deoxyhypusine synthase